MIVTCPRCLTKFNLADENLDSNIEINLRCSRCGEEFVLAPQEDTGDLDGMNYPLPVSERESDGVDDRSEFTESEQLLSAAAKVLSDDTEIELEDGFEQEGEVLAVDPIKPESEPEPEPEPDSESRPQSEQEVDAAVDIDELSSVADDDNLDDLLDFELEMADADLGDILDAETSADGEIIGEFHKREKEEVASVAAESPAKPKLAAEPEPGSASDGSQKRTPILLFLCFLILGLALWAGYSLRQHFSVNLETHLQLQEVSNQRLRLPSERVVVVLRGKVVNPSPNMVTDLKIKGVLVDASGQVVAEMVTSGGVIFSEEELDHLNDGKLAILEKSAVNLPPNGGELPFMIAFYDYPDGASKCYVEISSFKVKKETSVR